MAKAEKHPLYVGKIAELPTYWDCDDLDVEGLHLRQVRKDDEYNFYNSKQQCLYRPSISPLHFF